MRSQSHRVLSRALVGSAVLLLLQAVAPVEAQTARHRGQSSNGRITFSDNFANLANWTFIAPDTPDGRGGPKFNEAGHQWWTNPNNPHTPDRDLYIARGNGLELGLKPTPVSQQSYINSRAGAKMPFVGTLLASYRTSYQQYGTWQITATVPAVPGTSFQADTENVQVTGTWPPEIDLRISTDQSGVQTVLYGVASKSGWRQWTTSSSQGFNAAVSHIYAWDWEPDTISFYIDGNQVWHTPTPQDGSYTSHPMFLFLLTGANYIGNGDPDPNSLNGYKAIVSNVTVYSGGAGARRHDDGATRKDGT